MSSALLGNIHSRVAGVQRCTKRYSSSTVPAPLQHPAFADIPMFRPAPSLAYINPNELADILKSGEKAQVQVIDVRDSDFEGGHIKGAINVESSQFYDDSKLDELITGPCSRVDKVVVHCMMSQIRGPKSARLLAARLEEHDGINKPTVLVLRGGFQRFAYMFKDDPELVQDLNPSMWSQ